VYLLHVAPLLGTKVTIGLKGRGYRAPFTGIQLIIY